MLSEILHYETFYLYIKENANLNPKKPYEEVEMRCDWMRWLDGDLSDELSWTDMFWVGGLASIEAKTWIDWSCSTWNSSQSNSFDSSSESIKLARLELLFSLNSSLKPPWSQLTQAHPNSTSTRLYAECSESAFQIILSSDIVVYKTIKFIFIRRLSQSNAIIMWS